MDIKKLIKKLEQYNDDVEVYINEKHQLEIGKVEVIDDQEKFIVVKKININND